MKTLNNKHIPLVIALVAVMLRVSRTIGRLSLKVEPTKQFTLQCSKLKNINQNKETSHETFILCTLLVVVFGVYSHVQAQFKESGPAWGLSAGGAKGDNNANDRWVMQYRGFIQYGIPMLIGQFGIGYAEFAGRVVVLQRGDILQKPS